MSVGFVLCLADFMQRFNVCGYQKKNFETNGYAKTAIEHPLCFATLSLGSKITIVRTG